MKCKYCNTDGLEWPANYKKGDKPIEGETGRVHDQDRCKSFQGANTIQKHGWLEVRCEKCHVLTRYNRKRFSERTIPRPCRDCKMESFNNLSDYGISL